MAVSRLNGRADMNEENKIEINQLREEFIDLKRQVSVLYSVVSAIVENLPPGAAETVKHSLGRPSRAPIDIGNILNAVTRAQGVK
jgi:hypothetical protein